VTRRFDFPQDLGQDAERYSSDPKFSGTVVSFRVEFFVEDVTRKTLLLPRRRPFGREQIFQVFFRPSSFFLSRPEITSLSLQQQQLAVFSASPLLSQRLPMEEVESEVFSFPSFIKTVFRKGENSSGR